MEPGLEAEEGSLCFPLAPRDHSERQEENGNASPIKRGVPPSQPGGVLRLKPRQREACAMGGGYITGLYKELSPTKQNILV